MLKFFVLELGRILIKLTKTLHLWNLKRRMLPRNLQNKLNFSIKIKKFKPKPRNNGLLTRKQREKILRTKKERQMITIQKVEKKVKTENGAVAAEKRKETKEEEDDEEKTENNEKEEKKEREYEKGLIVQFKEVGEGVTRELLKTVFGQYGNVEYVDFNRGNPSGFIRFEKADQAAKSVATIPAEKVEIGGKVPEVNVLGGDEEVAYWQKVNNLVKDKKGGRGGKRGGRGGKRGGRGGRGGKRKRF